MPEDLVEEFATAINAAFQGDESGHVYVYLYKDPRPDQTNGKGLDKTLHGSPDYYVFQNGLHILDHYKNEWAQKLGQGRPYIELGIGSGAALVKSKKLIEAFKPSACIINDQSPVYVDHARAELSQWAYENGLSATIQGITGDFTDPSITWNRFKDPIVVLQGCTIQNYDNVQEILRTLARIAGPHGDILLDYDTNQNHKHLKKAYGSPYQIQHRLEILKYVQDLFDPAGFNFNAFYWKSEWRSRQHLLLQKLVCDVPQSFSIRGVHHQNVRGIVVSKMHKYSTDNFLVHVKASGLHRQGLYPDQDGLVMMDHLKPALQLL